MCKAKIRDRSLSDAVRQVIRGSPDPVFVDDIGADEMEERSEMTNIADGMKMV
jgi:hypothetical protein